MPVLEIIKIPSPVLHEKCRLVKELNQDIKNQIIGLSDTLADPTTKGVGLAAPQLGFTTRICVVLKFSQEKDAPPTEFVLINPVITKFSSPTDIRWEGCLSIPDTFCKIQRSKEITVTFININGEAQKLKATGFFARVIQHEVDHLDGILITDKCVGEPVTEAELDKLMEGEKLRKND